MNKVQAKCLLDRGTYIYQFDGHANKQTFRFIIECDPCGDWIQNLCL